MSLFSKLFRKSSTEKSSSSIKPESPTSAVGRSSAEERFRAERIEEILANTPVENHQKMLKVLDLWVVDTGIERSGNQPERVTYLPRPLWDNEAALTRESFPTEEAAVAYIHSVGGKLLTEVAPD